MPLDHALVAETRAWLEKAQGDLEASRRCAQGSPPLYPIAAFLAQQAAEKALKGFLTFHQTDFEKTHKMDELGQKCATIAPSLSRVAALAAPLTRYAVEGRYPGPWLNPGEKEAREALDVATQVYDSIIALLPSETRP